MWLESRGTKSVDPRQVTPFSHRPFPVLDIPGKADPGHDEKNIIENMISDPVMGYEVIMLLIDF